MTGSVFHRALTEWRWQQCLCRGGVGDRWLRVSVPRWSEGAMVAGPCALCPAAGVRGCHGRWLPLRNNPLKHR